MRPDSISFLLVLAISSSLLLHPATSECVRRNGASKPFNPSSTRKFSPPPPTPKPTPAPSPKASIYSPIKAAAKSLSKAVSNAIGAGALKPICANTDYPDVCVSSIQSAAKSLRSINLESAVGFQMDAALTRTHAAIDEAKKVMGNAGYGDCLKDCIDNYDDALDNLETSKKALLTKDVGTMNSMLSGAYGSFNCNETFAEGQELGTCKLESPMNAHDDVLMKMTSNILALLEKSHF